jgi:hypothetical protein
MANILLVNKAIGIIELSDDALVVVSQTPMNIYFLYLADTFWLHILSQ